MKTLLSKKKMVLDSTTHSFFFVLKETNINQSDNDVMEHLSSFLASLAKSQMMDHRRLPRLCCSIMLLSGSLRKRVDGHQYVETVEVSVSFVSYLHIDNHTLSTTVADSDLVSFHG